MIYRANVPRSAVTGRYITAKDEAMGKHEALVARMRAALKLIYPDDITPMGRRMLERILDEESESLDE